MCGIAGIYNPQTKKVTTEIILKGMVRSLNHRGPDEQGYYIDERIALGQTRLSIIDLQTGNQPLYNEDHTIATICNGEIFNYIELREELRKKGHHFRSSSDTEVLVHAYEAYGLDFLPHLNGQFALAIWDERRQQLILARDRVGIRPLFYATLADGTLLFASEAKALFCHPDLDAQIDPTGIDQVFTLWMTIPPTTVFKGVHELAPAHMMIISAEGIRKQKYWQLSFPEQSVQNGPARPFSDCSEELTELLSDAVRLRLRADVPVGAYLSGGIDSSITTCLAREIHSQDLQTFSVNFSDNGYDEKVYQEKIVNMLQTDHHSVPAEHRMISDVFSDVVRQAEKPILRTAPAPLYLLSQLVHDSGLKVVLTGEGADEVFAGYNIFKENKVRRFWAQQPDSQWRGNLLDRIYPYQNGQRGSFWQQFFKKDFTNMDNPYYSHVIRWQNTAQVKSFFCDAYRENFSEQQHISDALDHFVDPNLINWHPLSRAQYLEMQLFMSGYLLSSQGDRMLMAHSVEGRFPFLDHRVIEFAAGLPPQHKLHVLNEKYILKKTFATMLPHSIINRTKQPYRAPAAPCFNRHYDNLTMSVLQPDKLKTYGYFNPDKVDRLLTKAEDNHLSAREEMALCGIASLQLLHYHFVDSPLTHPPTPSLQAKRGRGLCY